MNHRDALLWCEGERDGAQLRVERALEANSRLVKRAVVAFQDRDWQRGTRLARAALRCRTIARFWGAYAGKFQRLIDHHMDALLAGAPRGAA